MDRGQEPAGPSALGSKVASASQLIVIGTPTICEMQASIVASGIDFEEARAAGAVAAP